MYPVGVDEETGKETGCKGCPAYSVGEDWLCYANNCKIIEDDFRERMIREYKNSTGIYSPL